MISRFEMLEPRVLLAGDVTVTISANGVLKVTGDLDDNTVDVATTAGGAMTFTGTATTINGAAAVLTLTADDVDTITKIKVNMKQGGDTLTWDHTLHPVATVTKADFNLGTGINALVVTEVDVTGNMSLKGGNEMNTFITDTTTVGGNLTVKTGKFMDVITLDTPTVTKKLIVKGGTGADTVTLISITADSTKVFGTDEALVFLSGDVDPDADITVKGAVIADNNAPTVTNAADLLLLLIPEDAVTTDAVTEADGSTEAFVVGDDADDNPLTYEITAGNDDGIFGIDQDGALFIADDTNLGDAPIEYNLTVTVSDHADSVDTPVTITVAAVGP